jgi:hypothetical protein
MTALATGRALACGQVPPLTPKGLTDQEFEDAFDNWLAIDPYSTDFKNNESMIR